MKEILSVETRSYPKIDVIWQRGFLEDNAVLISIYAANYYSAYKYIGSHQRYIRALSKSVDYLYKYYELGKRYFELSRIFIPIIIVPYLHK